MQHIEQIQINGIVHWSMVNTKVVCGTDFVTDNLRGLTLLCTEGKGEVM